ncbi:MerR family transcriptional regulator [Streptomyces chartreusis]
MAEEPPTAAPRVTVIAGAGDGLPQPAPLEIPERLGYRGPTACAAVGVTYRQLDYWARTGLVEPSVRSAPGQKTKRLYVLKDVVLLRIVKRFLDTGVSLQIIRDAVQRLRSRRIDELTRLTLISDGSAIHECSTPEEVHALLLSGEGVFGLAIGVVVREVEQALAALNGERIEQGGPRAAQNAGDELARRRHRAG